MNKGDFRILLTRDKDSRTLTISDNGIGMTREELEQNLGTIAHSGSLDFKKDTRMRTSTSSVSSVSASTLPSWWPTK